METNNNKPLGALVRDLRVAKGISLRGFAKEIEKTPTLVSRFERGEDIKLAEATLMKMAQVLDHDADDFLFQAQKMPSDLADIVKAQPKPMTALLRTAQSLTPEQLNDLARQAQEQSDKNKDNSDNEPTPF